MVICAAYQHVFMPRGSQYCSRTGGLGGVVAQLVWRWTCNQYIKGLTSSRALLDLSVSQISDKLFPDYSNLVPCQRSRL